MQTRAMLLTLAVAASRPSSFILFSIVMCDVVCSNAGDLSERKKITRSATVEHVNVVSIYVNI